MPPRGHRPRNESTLSGSPRVIYVLLTIEKTVEIIIHGHTRV